MLIRPDHIRFAVRSLRRTPGFSILAVLILALGIGLSTAVFTVAHTLLLRSLPVADQDGLVVLWSRSAGQEFKWPVSLADVQKFAPQTRSLQNVAFFAYEGAWPTPVRDGDRMTPMALALVSGEFFDLLGVRPALGRAFHAEDDVIGAAPIAVLSHQAWQRYFGGTPDILGRKLLLHLTGVTYAVVGVMPQGLDFPRGTDFWSPLVPGTARRGDSASAYVNLIGRLRPGLSTANAQDDLTAFFHRPGGTTWEQSLRGEGSSFPRLVVGDIKPALLAFTVAAALLLLITCINVANLLFVRGLARLREVAVRSALGASRGQVLLQLLAENAILALVGGAVGVLLAAGAIWALVDLAPAGLPRLSEIGINAAALGGAVAITTITMLLSGLAPALLTSRVSLQHVLRSDTRHSASRGSRRATEGLVAGQIALAVVVLGAAGLTARSLLELQNAKLAFDSQHLLVSQLTIRVDRFDTQPKQLALLDRIVQEVKAIPGVLAVSPVNAVPFSGSGGWDGQLASEGQTDADALRNPMLNLEVVTPDYFPTFGLPLLRGRTFTEADRGGTPNVVVLSESAARHYWPGVDPVGKRLTMGAGAVRDTVTVVGIVPDTRYRDLRDARASIYYPLRQSSFPYAPTNLAIRASGRPADVAAVVRRVVGAIDPAVAVVRSEPFDSYLDGPLAQPRLNALLLGVFAGAAAILAAVGLFGIMATMVRQRTRELGLRMALGATSENLRWMVLRRGLGIAAAGLGVGVAVGVMANRLLSAMLYRVSPTDGATLLVVSGLMLGVAAVAILVPARASTRIDPIVALRSDG